MGETMMESKVDDGRREDVGGLDLELKELVKALAIHDSTATAGGGA